MKMTKIQLDLSENQSKFIKHWAVKYKCKQTDALKDIINEFIINYEQGILKLHNPNDGNNRWPY
jgi:hypothetical protein